MSEFDEFYRLPFTPNTAAIFMQTPYAFHGAIAPPRGNKRLYIATAGLTEKICEEIYGTERPIKPRPPYQLSS